MQHLFVPVERVFWPRQNVETTRNFCRGSRLFPDGAGAPAKVKNRGGFVAKAIRSIGGAVETDISAGVVGKNRFWVRRLVIGLWGIGWNSHR